MRLAISQLPREPAFCSLGYTTLTRDYAILPMLGRSYWPMLAMLSLPYTGYASRADSRWDDSLLVIPSIGELLEANAEIYVMPGASRHVRAHNTRYKKYRRARALPEYFAYTRSRSQHSTLTSTRCGMTRDRESAHCHCR